MTEPLVSIIIPTYNTSATLEELLKALESMDYPKSKINIIFIDGGSNDGTLNILRNWSLKVQKKFSHIEIIEINQRGVTIARNIGIKEAISKYNADFIFMLDSDVIPPPWFLRHALKYFLMKKKIGIVAAPVIASKKNLFEVLNMIRWPYPWGYVEIAPPGAWLMNKDCILDVGLFNEKLGYPNSDWEQAEYSAKVRKKGWKIVLDWKLECEHKKKLMIVYKENINSFAKMLEFGIKRYLFFLPHIWHEMIKARPKYYIVLTILHLIVPISLLLTLKNPVAIIYPLFIVLFYYYQNTRNKVPLPTRFKILSALALTYMRTLIAIGYSAWMFRYLLVTKRLLKRLH